MEGLTVRLPRATPEGVSKSIVLRSEPVQIGGMVEVRFKKGVELPGHGLWLDPHRAKPMAFVSHAHSDHLGAHAEVVLTPETARLMQARMGGKRREHVLLYDVPREMARAQIRLLPAGHICGSSQLYLESDAGSLLYTGDFKLRASRSTEACAWRRADTLVMETTFGLPKYQLPPQHQVEAAVARFCRDSLDAGMAPALLTYSLGKAQEVVWALLEHGFVPMLHPAAFRMTDICRQLRAGFPEGYVIWDQKAVEGKVLILPPGRVSREWLSKVALRIPVRTAVLTGWAMDAGARFRHQCDAAFPWSDHADYPDLLRYVELVQPKRVLTLHGFAAAFAADLRARGVEAWALSQENQLELAL